jgi:hypothetical protein
MDEPAALKRPRAEHGIASQAWQRLFERNRVHSRLTNYVWKCGYG